MLTLISPLTIAGFTVYQDDANNLDASPPVAVNFYVLPKAARIAVDDSGRPALSLLVYQAPPAIGGGSAPARGGGVLQFTVDLSLSDADLSAIQSGLSDRLGGADAPIAPLPVQGGALAIELAGVRVQEQSLDGVSPPFARALMLSLSASGAADLVASKSMPLGLHYRLDVAHKISLRSFPVSCSAEAAANLLRASAGGAPGWDDPAEVAAASLFDMQLVSINYGPTNLRMDVIDDVERLVQDEVARRVRPLLAALPPDGADNAALQKYVAAVQAALTFTVGPDAPLAGALALDCSLADALAALDWSSLTNTIVLTPPLLRATVRVDGDFAHLPFDSVHVTVTHHGKHDTSQEYRFTGATSDVFRCWLDPGDSKQLSWTARVYYKDSPLTFDLSGAGAGDLAIALGEAGLLDATVQLGMIDFGKLPHASVTLRYLTKAGAETRLVLLDETHASARVIAPIGDTWNGDVDYQVTWVRSDGYRIERPWNKATGGKLTLESPIVGELPITITPAGDFGGGADAIAQIAVSLRYRDPANKYEQQQQVVLTSNASVTATFDLLDASKTDYDYRYAIIHRSGLMSQVPADEGQWLTSSSPALGMGEVEDIDLTIDPGQLAMGSAFKIVKADVSLDDAAGGASRTRSFVFTSSSHAPVEWKGASGAPGTRSYHVAVTYYGTDGTVTHAPVVVVTGSTYAIPATPPATTTPPPAQTAS